MIASLKQMPAAVKPVLRKVCGITKPGYAEFAITAGANAIGLIFYKKSPRSVLIHQAQEIASVAPDHLRRVGVFVNEQADTIATTVKQVNLNVIQLHGEESPEDCERIRQAVGEGREIWKAVRVRDGFDASAMAEYGVDAFLLDTAKGGAFGGTGQTFPWELALQAKQYGQVILSGGLHGGNVAEAIRVVEPWGVDASSKLEIEPGVKDIQKMTAFLSAAK